MLMQLQKCPDAEGQRCILASVPSAPCSQSRGRSTFPERSQLRRARRVAAGRAAGRAARAARHCRAGGGRVSLARQGLRLLCCSLFPFAKVGVAGMSPLLRRGAEPCPLERGDVSIKKTQRGRFPKIKPSIPSRRCQCQRQARRCLELPAERGISLAARRAGPAALLLFLLLRGPPGSPLPGSALLSAPPAPVGGRSRRSPGTGWGGERGRRAGGPRCPAPAGDASRALSAPHRPSPLATG